jgi:hypothetical protein
MISGEWVPAYAVGRRLLMHRYTSPLRKNLDISQSLLLILRPLHKRLHIPCKPFRQALANLVA